MPVILDSLRSRREFEGVFSTGERRRSGPLVVVVAPRILDSRQAPARTADRSMRLGLVAGRKVGNAVERNRAKRRLRHAVRVVGGVPGADVVIIAHRRVLTASWLELLGWVADGLGVGDSVTDEGPVGDEAVASD